MSRAKPIELASRVLQDVRHGTAPSLDSEYARSVLWDDNGSRAVSAMLASNAPCMAARFGSTELACVTYYLRWRKGRTLPLPYPKGVRRIIAVNSGFFPTDDASIDRFCEIYLDAATQADVMAVWFNRSEERVIREYCPDASLIHLEALNTVIRDDPWSAQLEGLTVLVVHPFARTIESQYETNRALLFEDQRVLPEFKLKTFTAVQSLGGTHDRFASWFDAYTHMRDEIASVGFDVAIIGAGAYGLPLAASVKRSGRQAVHMGGATQLLFGVRGRRWEVESPDDVAPLFNEHWVRASAEETPECSQAVEGGCYW